jgi:hypothetical protein
MKTFYVWISILIDEYEPIITQNLISLGYSINSINGAINKDKLLAYKISHIGKSLKHAETDLRDIVSVHGLKCHSCVLVETSADGFQTLWWGSNITFPSTETVPEVPEPPTPPDLQVSEEAEIDDVVAEVNRILNNESARLRVRRPQC